MITRACQSVAVLAFVLASGPWARAETLEIKGYAFVYPPVPASQELDDEDVYEDQAIREADISAMSACFLTRGQPDDKTTWELLFPSSYTYSGCQIDSRSGYSRHKCWATATIRCVLPESSLPQPEAATRDLLSTDGGGGAEGASAVNPYEGGGGAASY